MTPTLPTSRILYLLTAIMLLMQSFAIWHDSEHAFHHNTQECTKFQVLNHTPTADLATAPELFHSSSICSIEQLLSIALLEQDVQENHPIRAPPNFVSALYL